MHLIQQHPVDLNAHPSSPIPSTSSNSGPQHPPTHGASRSIPPIGIPTLVPISTLSLSSITLRFPGVLISIVSSVSIECSILSNNQRLVNIRVNEFALFMVLVCLGISSRAISNTTDHSSTTEPSIRSVPTVLPQPPTISPIVPNPISISPSGLDRSGTISHPCINPRSSKTRSGIKAVIHNKMGDRFPLITPRFSYYRGNFRVPYYNDLLLVSLFSIRISSILRIMVLLAISLPTVSTSSPKPAQYPSSPRLPSATSAPTPTSSSPHPPTTATSGVHSGSITDPSPTITTNLFMWFFIVLLLSIILSSIIPSSKAIPSSDTKPTTAHPTTSQTSHMFPRPSSIPHHAPHHTIVHGPLKSSLPPPPGPPTHVQLNPQSIHKMKPNNLMIKISSILGVCVSILPHVR